MHQSLKLLSFIVFMKLVTALAQFNNDPSALYYPTEKGGTFQPPNYNLVQISDVEPIRETRVNEEHITRTLVKGASTLAVTLNKLLTNQPQVTNVIFSPMNVYGTIALILLGANGVTFKELAEFMGLAGEIPDFNTRPLNTHEQFAKLIRKIITSPGVNYGVDVTVAGAVFVQKGYPIRPQYRSAAEEIYRSHSINVDFEGNGRAALSQINKWASDNTNGRIRNLLEEVPSSDTKVIVASAIFFKAEWEHHFFEGSTKRRPYYLNGRKYPSLHQLDMMSNGGEFPYYKDQELGCEILGLPYKGNASTMYIILPFDSSQEKLHQFEWSLTANDVEKLVSRTKRTAVVILFPKMRIESSSDLRRTLQVLGVQSLFNPYYANLALISPGEQGSRVDTSSPVNSVYGQSPVYQSTESTQSRESTNRQIFFPNRVSERVTPFIGNRAPETLDSIRQQINQQSTDNRYQNPGLYADEIIHKVYLDINEMGTEAAAATSVSLSRDGGRVTFRVDVPFLFLIRHEETKAGLFWGSVALPTPNYRVY